ncbi:hypothetical protein EYC80_006342 [Monilinia laxa]|uniref:Phospholipid/glycerol acyltransferase domain-containing protein n=1 Tax=Monilinia laxa TaxID=61186 RepID=A0A5N6JUB2_MONLA|nr:hypothetical protein EYC80_006342 [Monilinia laxa]
MEKYSQFRDRGSGIAPFLPVQTPSAGIYTPVYLFLFLFKLPFFLTVSTSYFLFLQWFPLGSLLKKAILWMILGIPGVWWIDLQIDGVKKGSLAKKREGRFIKYPFLAQFSALSKAQRNIHQMAQKMTDLSALLIRYPGRAIVVFPESTTTNGKGILPVSSSLLTAPSGTKIFPISLRYSPSDITTPIPGKYWPFFWNLLSKPTHCIKVRIAEVVYNTSRADGDSAKDTKYLKNHFHNPNEDTAYTSSTDDLNFKNDFSAKTTLEEQRVLDKVGEALARLGRVKRVGLTVKDKIAFVDAWNKKR